MGFATMARIANRKMGGPGERLVQRADIFGQG
jgi:hypothetical protein